jgi:23S rRNA (uracil1939-C5)-methyltransferase
MLEAPRVPPCVFADRCGGCGEMGWEEGDQLIRKRDAATRALRRPIDAVVQSPLALGYRARVSLAVGPSGLPGFHRAGTHEPIVVDDCLVARPAIRQVMADLPALPRGVTRVELRTDGQRVVACAQARPGAREADVAASLSDWRPAGLHGLAVGGRVVWGDPTLWLAVAGVRHQLSPGTFFQVNLEINELLTQAVLAAAMEVAPRHVLDLFAGCGNLGLPIAMAGPRTVLVEQAGSAARDARRTASRMGLDVDVRTADAARFSPGDAFFDVALLDPPRAGAAGLLTALLAIRPRRIIYVSCNARALGRDLEEATQQGYRVSRLDLFDMFPQTEHGELLCVLDPA